jgi:hypothetical protein
MAMANQENLPLYEKIWLKRTFQRAIDILILLLLFSLLCYRLFFSIINNSLTLPWFLAFSCESWFTFTWIVLLNAKWSPAVTKTYPKRLLQQYVITIIFSVTSGLINLDVVVYIVVAD